MASSIFVNEAKDQLRIHVSSRLLMLNSPVFNQKLQRFLTGKRHPQGNERLSQEYTIKEADPEALSKLCMALHLRSDLLTTSLPIEMLLRVSASCRTYECQPGLNLWCKSWYSKSTGATRTDLELWMVIAMNFDNAEVFMAVTRTLLLESSLQDIVANTEKISRPLLQICGPLIEMARGEYYPLKPTKIRVMG
jgi:hypothetical protein